MRLTLVSVGLLLGLSAGQGRQAVFVPVGVVYAGGPSAEQELQTIRSLGFNSIKSRAVAVDHEMLMSLARAAGLHVFAPGDPTPGAVEVLAGPPQGAAGGAGSADVRLAAWEAVARGARAIFFSGWSGPDGLVDDEGIVTPRARAAGEFAGIVSRNAALFSALRPAAGETPRVRVQGDTATIDAWFLESATAVLLIAVNRANYAQKVTLHFSPDVPEAIWQNLENGTAVSFVMDKNGPSLTHAFLARDVLVLVRAKRLR